MSRRKSSKKTILAILIFSVIAIGGAVALSNINFDSPSGGGGGGGDIPIVDNNGTPTALIINETPIVF